VDQGFGPFCEPPLEHRLKRLFICGSEWGLHNPAVKTLTTAGPLPLRRGAAAVAALLLLVCLLPAARASKRDGNDHDLVRAAVQAGQVMPLHSLLERLRRSHPGQVLALELEQEDGRWLYEVKLLQADGQLLKLELDAHSGELLRARRKGDRTDERKDERRR
jgi:uncharacterized membrane protein YkoI